MRAKQLVSDFSVTSLARTLFGASLCIVLANLGLAQDGIFMGNSFVSVSATATTYIGGDVSQNDQDDIPLWSTSAAGVVAAAAFSEGPNGTAYSSSSANYGVSLQSGMATFSYSFAATGMWNGGWGSAGVNVNYGTLPDSPKFDIDISVNGSPVTTYSNQNGYSVNTMLYENGDSVMWRINDSPFPGQMPDGTNKSGDGNDPSDSDVNTKLDENTPLPPEDEPVGEPANIAGAALVATLTAGPVESSYYHYHYSAPVIEDFYGAWDPFLDPTYQNYYPTYFGDSSIVSADDTPVTGYLFMNTGGGDFTSFTIPEALAGGDDEFKIMFEQEAYDLSVGEIFSFSGQTGSTEVDSFILTGIDESEMFSSAAEVPFTFGLTNWDDTYTEFVAIPLVPLPDGDFTGDRLVNGMDFLAWQLGESPNPFSSEDLATWEENYGAHAPVVAALVPEPTALVLASVAGLICCFR